MFKSIKFKLWLTFFITLVLSLSVLLMVTHWLMQQRFMDFSLRALEEQLPPLEERLIDIYTRSDSLDILKNNSPLWHKLVGESIFYGHILEESDPFTKKHYSNKTALPAQNKPKVSLPKVDPRWHELKHNQKAFVRSLALFDKNKTPIAGQLKPNCQQYWHPVYLEDQVIAHIAFEVPKHPLRRSQQLFMEQQFNHYLLLMCMMIIAALLLAIVVSRWLLKPLQDLSQNAQRLALGDFSTRVELKNRQDELGKLCQNFNDMAAKLESNELNRRQWVADISHEMRTPLAVLKAQIEAIQDGVRPANKENISLLASRIDALNYLINDLFELALSDLGALKYDKKSTDLHSLISDFVRDNRTRVEAAGHIFEFKGDTNGKCLTDLDENRFLQVLENLLENSLRYTESPGIFRWSLSCSAKEITATFEDSAPGVDPQYLGKIFDRLYRLEQSRNRESGGAGLGLSLCKNIIEAHNGVVDAHTSSLGGLKIKVVLLKVIES